MLTLKPEQPVSWFHYERTEEGWSEYGSSWRLCLDGTLVVEHWSDGTDCDGRLSTESIQVAEAPRPGLDRWPHWQDESRSQRDYSAEAAGY